MLKPIVKYQGGKSRELSLIRQLSPSQFHRVIEPFCGGAAVSFFYGCPSVLSDIHRDIINLYQVVASEEFYSKLQVRVNELQTLDHDELEKEYYAARDVINQSWKEFTDCYERALSYIIVRQLCFSGMERYNANGEFNVPFGHYKKMSCNLSPDHHQFLKKQCMIQNQSFESTFSEVQSDDFIFLDPPYLERLGYTQGDGGLDLHEKLLFHLKSTSAKWLLIHSDHEFYRDSYKDYSIHVQDFSYAQRFGKNKDHSKAKVSHLYICNY